MHADLNSKRLMQFASEERKAPFPSIIGATQQRIHKKNEPPPKVKYETSESIEINRSVCTKKPFS